jgi:hypothetical protein
MAVTLLGAIGRDAAPPFTLVHDAEPACTIVTPADPGRSVAFAVAELQHHVELITGTRLPVVDDTTPVHGPRILVGASRATAALGLDPAAFAFQEYLVRVTPNTVVLMGCDNLPAESRPAADPSPDWTDGRFGHALSFNGRDQALPVHDLRFPDHEGSLECWVRLSPEPQPHEGTILRLDGTGPWTYHILRRMESSDSVGYFTYDGEHVRGITSAPLAPGWHHLLATHSAAAGKARLYVDGVLAGEADYLPTTCAGARLDIGGLALDGSVGNPFHGSIDEVRVSSTVRAPVPDVTSAEPPAEDADTVLLLHFDEGAGPVAVGDTGLPGNLAPPGFFAANGTLYAVYDFLEHHCGVRWYAPGDLGTVLTPRKTLTAAAVPERRRSPAMGYRWITPTALYWPAPPTALPSGQVDLWKLRMRIGGEDFGTTHSFYGYYGRFLDQHPDWFAKGYDGRPPQPCFTHPEFRQRLLQDAREYADGHASYPGAQNRGRYFGIVPEDNGSWCRCPDCQALLDHGQEQNLQFSRGLASNYVWGLVNEVAAGLRQTHPDAWVAALAYADYAYVPDALELEPNIAVQMCLHTRNWWAPPLARNDRRIFDSWVAESNGERPLYVWLYYNFPMMMDQLGGFRAFPGFFVHTAIEQMHTFHRAGIRGIFMEHSSEFGQSYLHDLVDLYVTLKLADDPELDGQGLVDEFFERYYGKAGPAMQTLYTAIEDTYSDPANYPPEVRDRDQHWHQSEEMAWEWLGTAERMDRFAALMAQAHRDARTEVEQARVQAFDQGVWQYMLQGRQEWLEKNSNP